MTSNASQPLGGEGCPALDIPMTAQNRNIFAVLPDRSPPVHASSCRTVQERTGAADTTEAQRRGFAFPARSPTEQPMTDDFDITTVRKLTALRNKPGLDRSIKQRLANIINTAENINREQTDMRYREQLIASFKKQWAEYEKYVAGHR